jgi:hypothetical protein
MITYELYVLDYSRHTDILPAKVENLDMAEQVFSALSELSPGVNPRFQRLAWQLRKRFPDRNGLPDDASDEEIEAYHDMEAPIWSVGNAPRMDDYEAALWQPEVRMEHMVDFLSVLVPLARKLKLDIYDRVRGIYLPAAGMAVPTKEGSIFRVAYDPEIAASGLGDFPDRQAQHSALLASLKQVLANHGFEAGPDFLHPFYLLRRPVEGGAQEVQVLFQAVGCELILRTKSARFAALEQALAPDKPGISPAHVFSVSLNNVREQVNPAWKNMDAPIRNQEEVDWLLSDLVQQGLPILEKARTIKGMDWLYNSSEAGARLFPFNRALKAYGGISHALTAVAYAYWAVNPDFDDIVEKLRAQIQEQQDPEDSERFEALVNYCRTALQPMGDGAA